MSIPPFAVGVLWLALILGVTAGFFVLARKLRQRRGGDRAMTASELLAEFRELRDEGELTDEEFNHIRTKLAPQLQVEAGSAAAGSTSMAEAAASLRGTAELLAGGWAGGADASERADRAGRSDQRDPTGTAGRDAHDGCDAAPPVGGDSTEDDR